MIPNTEAPTLTLKPGDLVEVTHGNKCVGMTGWIRMKVLDDDGQWKWAIRDQLEDYCRLFDEDQLNRLPQ